MLFVVIYKILFFYKFQLQIIKFFENNNDKKFQKKKRILFIFGKQLFFYKIWKKIFQLISKMLLV